MRYEIFQICYLPGQIKKAHPEFKILDRTAHNTGELREVECFQQTMGEGKTDELDAWGFFSPRWQDKLPHTPKQIREKIEANPNHDVYVFSHSLARTALFANPWEELFLTSWKAHITEAKKFMAFILGDLWPIGKDYYLEIFSGQTCYGNYFVAKRAFWEDYNAFIKSVILKLNAMPQDMRTLPGPLFSIDAPRESLYTQTIERLFSTFLHMNLKKYKPFYIENNFSCHQKRLDNISFDALLALYQLKKKTLNPSPTDFTNIKNWYALRLFTLKESPLLHSIDNPFSCNISNPEVIKI